MDIEPLVAPLRADVVSGATAVARKATGVVRRLAAEAPRDGLPAFRSRLEELAVGILDAQPAMAPLVTLSSGVLRAASEAEDEVDARDAVRGLESATAGVARAAGSLFRSSSERVLTLSASSTVEAALTRAADDRRIRVRCLEGRPVCEGRGLARRLARAGVRVTLAVDAAAELLVGDCDRVLLGADSVGDAGVVNKIGSVAVARAARAAGVPVHVLTDRTKLLPAGFPQPVDDDRPGEEVWRAPRGVRVWNRYFEHIPLELVASVVTEDGVQAARELEEERRHIEVPSRLREWAG